MKYHARLVALVVILGGTGSAPLLSQDVSSVPRLVTLQGLVRNGDVIAPDGRHTFTFAIYDQSTGGSVLFSETQDLDITGGVFDATIGGATAGGISTGLAFDRQYFVGVRVDGGPELVPRTPMTTAPYALRAATADTVGGRMVRSINGHTGDVTIPENGVQSVTNTDGSIEIFYGTGPDVQLRVQADGITTTHLRDGSVLASKIGTEQAPTGSALTSDGSSTPVWAYPTAQDLILPFARTQPDSAFLFSITNSGAGRAAFFQADSTTSYGGVLEATTSGSGLVAKLTSTNTTSFANSAVLISSLGSSIALQVYGGGGGGWFLPGYPGGVYASSGSGSALQGSSASGIGAYGGASTGTGVYAQARGTGNALIAVSENGGTSTTTSGNIALFKNTVNTGNVARISNTGKGFFNGGTQTSGADVAENMDVDGSREDFEPGDVLVVCTTRDRTVEKSAIPYSSAVVGVYATRPGVLLSDLNIDADQDSRIPMGVIGVIPTKVTSENGPIHRGDLLVTSSTKGHAMKASPIEVNGIRFYPAGVIIGKALEDFDQAGAGIIQVMVNVK